MRAIIKVPDVASLIRATAEIHNGAPVEARRDFTL
jgi:hypothetical protein